MVTAENIKLDRKKQSVPQSMPTKYHACNLYLFVFLFVLIVLLTQ